MRNEHSVSNLNTLTYLVISVRALQRARDLNASLLTTRLGKVVWLSAGDELCAPADPFLTQQVEIRLPPRRDTRCFSPHLMSHPGLISANGSSMKSMPESVMQHNVRGMTSM